MIIILATPAPALKLPLNVTVPAIIVFGDSIVDSGNNNYIKTLVKSNFPPYGRDFMGGLPTGRFSNGRILTDFLVEEFSIKQYVPPYLDPNLGPDDLLTGVSFASGGSGYDPLTSKITLVISLSQQLEHFKDYIRKLKRLVGEEKSQFILKNSVFMVLTGNNDLFGYFDIPLRRLQYDIQSYTDFLVNLASSFVQDLHNLGARRILVFSVIPVGCVPLQRTIAGGIRRKCAESTNRAAELFNSKLSAEVDSLTSKLPDSRVAYIDWYTPAIDVIQNPKKYGFEQVKRGCCGTGLIEFAILCNKLVPVCRNNSEYLFWDSGHFTERGYQTLFSLIIDKFVSLLFGTQ